MNGGSRFRANWFAFVVRTLATKTLILAWRRVRNGILCFAQDDKLFGSTQCSRYFLKGMLRSFPV